MKKPYRPKNGIFAHGKETIESDFQSWTLCGNYIHCKKIIESKLGMPNRLCDDCFKEFQRINRR